MKRISLLLSVLLIATIAGFSQERKVLGYWLTEKGTSQIKIFKATNGKYYGKIVLDNCGLENYYTAIMGQAAFGELRDSLEKSCTG